MGSYLSPGVYVEEIPSAVQPIAGVGTSTAGFIGIIPDGIKVPKVKITSNKVYTANGSVTTFKLDNYPLLVSRGISGVKVGTGDGTLTEFTLDKGLYPVVTDDGTFSVKVNGTVVTEVTLANDDTAHVAKLTFDTAPADDAAITGNFETKAGCFEVYLDGVPVSGGVTLSNNDTDHSSNLTFSSAPANGKAITVYYTTFEAFSPVAAGQVKICTNFAEFRKFFGDFSTDGNHANLAHAVYGFFNNGGTRCYVVRETPANISSGITSILEKFAAIDEIALVAAPGITDDGIRAALVSHCKVETKDRFAIFDSPETVETAGILDTSFLDPSNTANLLPDYTDYAAFYFPWIQVADPVGKLIDSNSDGRRYVPPSGHMAGIYARVDTQRGVHKAPANEPVMGAVGLKYGISKNKQDGLNPQGVNCIRDINGAVKVWGARTIGGDANGEWKYVNVRRLFLFLRESIDKGTQWVVFEPNDQALWAKITRNITAFLTTVWRSGALFGGTPQEAFYVKCDAETNPPEVRDQGQVVTEIGVAVVKPAEFVIFRICQWQGPDK